MAQKKRRWLLWVLLAALAILIIAVIFNKKNTPTGTEVEVQNSSLRTIKETVSASGKIFPATEVKISSDVSGEIVELYVKEGDSVHVGQVLAKIDPDTYESAVERGNASVSSSKAQLAISNAQIESNKAQAEQIKAQLENARSVHKRNDQLKNQGVISDVEFEQSLSNLRALEANLRASEASIKSAEQNSKAAEFTIKSSEASLKELRTSLSRTIIKAPMNGIISSLSVEQGERVVGTIQMQGTEMMRISNLNSMEVQVEVTENDIPRVSLQDFVEINVDAYVGKKFYGIVSEISNSASNLATATTLNTDQVTNFTVKIQVDPKSYSDLAAQGNVYPLRPGMSASVDIYTEEVNNAVVVPIQAVTLREKVAVADANQKLSVDDFEEVVFVMAGDTIQKVAVKTGIQDDEFIHVLSGLESGKTVVIGPYVEVSKNLKEGAKVHVKKVTEKK